MKMKTKVSDILKSDDTTKEKLDYLWGYYRVHVIVALIGLVFGIFLLVDWINRPVTYFHLTVLAPQVDFDEEEILSEEMQNLLNPQGQNEAVYASFTPHGEMAERFVAQLSAGEYDVILMDEGAFNEYASFGTMEEFRVVEIDEDEHYQPDEYNNPMAINSSALPVLDDYVTTADMYLMIPQNSNRKEITIEFFASQGYNLVFVD